MNFKHKLIMQIRYLKLQKAQMILLRDLEHAMNDLDRGYCDKIDKSPMEICQLIQRYSEGIKQRNKEDK